MTRSRQTADWGSRAGLVQMVPTSVAVGGGSATVSSNGLITCSSATTTITINSVFTTDYENYRIIVNGTITGSSYTSMPHVLRTGTTNLASGYTYYHYYRRPASFNSTDGSANTTWPMIYGGDNKFIAQMDLFSPYAAKSKGCLATSIADNSSTSLGHLTAGGSNTSTTSYESIQFQPGAAFTGTISVYGYTK